MRDPYSKLGGVASGLAHYYGLDVSLVRILFVLFALTTGFGFLLYFVAWLVIPRATHWPPAGSARSLRSLTGRDLAIVLVLGGLMFAVAAGAGGATGTVLVPLLLVGGGIWLLVQEPTESAAPTVPPGGAPRSTGAASSDLDQAADTANVGVGVDDTVASDPGDAAGSSDGSDYSGGGDDVYGSPGPIGQPVPPRSRRRRVGLIGIIVAGVLVVVAVPVLLVGALIAGIASGNIDFDFDQAQVQLIPTSTDAIPDSIVRDNAEIVIDLTTLDAADFDDLDGPIPVDAKTDVGSIRVIVPDDVAVDVQADVDIGSVSVLGESDDGFNSSVDVSPGSSEGEAAVELDLDVGIGEIVVERP